MSTPSLARWVAARDPWGLELAGTFQNLIDIELAKARRRIAAGATPARYCEQWVLDVGATR